MTSTLNATADVHMNGGPVATMGKSIAMAIVFEVNNGRPNIVNVSTITAKTTAAL